MVRMVGTGNPKAKYRTRRLLAGDEIEMTSSEARLARALRWAVPAPLPPPSPKRGPGRPPKLRDEPEPEPEVVAQEPEQQPVVSDDGDDYEGMFREDLLTLAQDRGLDLPEGYIRKDVLIQKLRGS